MFKTIARKTFKGIVLMISGIGLGKYLGKLKFIKGAEKNISQYFNPGYVTIDGHKIYLDKEDSLRLSTFGKLYENSDEHALFKKFIKKGDVVVDVGAFIGDDTLLFARLVGNKGKVYAFEVDKTNFDLIKKNIKENNYKNVIAINKAASDKNGKITLYIHPFRTTGHRVSKYDVSNKEVNWNTTKIPSTRLDSEIKGRVDFMKIDTEGVEPPVIKGAQRIIKENKNIKIILEISPSLINKFGITPEFYIESFIRQGFKIYDLDKITLEQIEGGTGNIKSIRDIQSFIEDYNNKTTNLFLIRGDQK
jgi:FkbM family methyltransferase